MCYFVLWAQENVASCLFFIYTILILCSVISVSLHTSRFVYSSSFIFKYATICKSYHS